MRALWIGFTALFIVSCGGNSDNASTTSSPQQQERVSGDEAPAPPAQDATGAECGGFANILCPSSYYCEQPAGQCLEVMDGVGTCQIKPEICTQEYAPVCGCDGQTYSNACTAAAAGASIAAEGECGGIQTE